jgi:hypothetical protein
MSIKWDKEKIALSVAGSLAVVVIGYLIWRHEQSVAVSTIQEENNAADDQASELEAELQALPQYAQGGGASEEESDTGSDAAVQSPPSDSNIAAILAAFGYNTGQTSTPTVPANSTTSTPTNPVPITPPNGTPAPVAPINIHNPPIINGGGSGTPVPEPVSGPGSGTAVYNPSPILTNPPTGEPARPIAPISRMVQ